eukprot:TRINITY_DN113_c0_g2_i1.p1 TRINITY_DN113_c0_g2~~TRINITY_DN113_c0_g2_i1.p1  ORF type:complete len:179 (-),score=5.95 TRINITY_DN113_c0_g2_i1:300-836(-)
MYSIFNSSRLELGTTVYHLQSSATMANCVGRPALGSVVGENCSSSWSSCSLPTAYSRRLSLNPPLRKEATFHRRGQEKQGGRRHSRLVVTAIEGDIPNLQVVILMAGATAAIASSLAFGLRGDPVPCDKCGGNGGAACVFCTDGKMSTKNGLIDCRVCRGAGLVFCKQCSGTGYVRRM